MRLYASSMHKAAAGGVETESCASLGDGPCMQLHQASPASWRWPGVTELKY